MSTFLEGIGISGLGLATLTLRIPDELDRELERQSAASHPSKGDLAREALQRYLRVTKVRALCAKLIPRAQAQGIHTGEDAYRALGEPRECCSMPPC